MEYDISNTDSFAHQGIVILNVFIAIVLAALVGFERESNNKPAGLRTNMIIAAVAVLLVSLGRGLAHEFSTIEGVRIDPIRIIEAIIVGVSFIDSCYIRCKPNIFLLTSIYLRNTGFANVSINKTQYYYA